MQIEGDKNSALPAADIQPDGQTKGFNQPNKEETHARLSEHTQKHTHAHTVGSVTVHTDTHTPSVGLCQSGAPQGTVSCSFSSSPPLQPSTPPRTSSPKRPEALVCKQLQSVGVK